jgi:translation initiation factor 5
MLNINNSDDIDYRYKMPPISIKLGGVGNGIFTIINNILEISKSLNTPEDVLIKFISYNTGSSYNIKNNAFTGHHSNMQDIIFDYINNFVICSACNIPELTYDLEKISSKKNNLICKCLACGTINNIKHTKINDKIIDFITKYLIKNKWIDNNY